MCGIAGIVSHAGPPVDHERALGRMVAALVHRGPDDRGTAFVSAARPGSWPQPPRAWLGNTRLAILDLGPAGHQPMHDPASGNWIVLNGEIYNHREVRGELGRRVPRWLSSSDTETVLRAYAVWGADCLERLRGMFAVAIWDAAAGELWCARDRLGIKPFYYHEQAGTFRFASEVRAILASGCVPVQIDRPALAGYVRFGAVTEPGTLIEGVRSLPAGHWVRVGRAGVVEPRPYWRPAPARHETPPRALGGIIRDHLERAVREHLLSDVPVACFLSGGIDSSIVAALAARATRAPLRSFVVGFPDAGLDESAAARAIAARCGTDHYEIVLSDRDVAARVAEAVRAMDLPSADAVNTFIVSHAAASSGTKVALSGLGGDELFGGYPAFRVLPLAHRWAPLTGRLPDRWRCALAGGGSTGDRAAALTDRAAPLRARYEALRAYWSDAELRAMGISPNTALCANDSNSRLPITTRVSLLELEGYMRSTLLRDTDAMAMAHGLELRVPFLDHALVECCLRFGVAGRGVKTLLVRAAADLVPPGLARRPKQGFVLPMARWMRGPIAPLVRDGLAAFHRARLLPLLDADALWRRFESGRIAWSRVWQFAVLGHWLETNLAATAGAAPAARPAA